METTISTEISKMFVNLSSTIKDALKILEKGDVKLALVVDDEEKLIGSLSDGDIRRALLDGLTIDAKLNKLDFKYPIVANINDSKEELIATAISKRLYQIPIVNKAGKVVAIEDLAKLLKVTHKKNHVVLMAGGLGSRLRPLTDDIPKPLLHVGGKPILETIISNFASYGFVNITISLNYKANMIKSYFGDGSKFGVNITYIEESKRLGTAGALSLIKDKPNEPFFVMNADLLTNINFAHLLDFHNTENSIATMCVREYDFQVPYGVIETNDGQISAIEEKPVHSFFVNAGIYVLSPEVFNEVPEDNYFDMPTLFESLISQSKKTVSFPIHEYWLDIGQMEEYKKANEEYSKVF